MGYDMYVRPIPHGSRPADYYNSDQYLRRNIFGMHPTVEAMVELGMAFWSEHGPFPEYPGYEHFDAEDEPVTDEGREYAARVAKLLSWHGDDPQAQGIPSHKFTSNDGWHVTKQECEQALAAYDAAMAAGHVHPERWFRDDLIPFLRHAAAADGFEVH